MSKRRPRVADVKTAFVIGHSIPAQVSGYIVLVQVIVTVCCTALEKRRTLPPTHGNFAAIMFMFQYWGVSAARPVAAERTRKAFERDAHCLRMREKDCDAPPPSSPSLVPRGGSADSPTTRCHSSPLRCRLRSHSVRLALRPKTKRRARPASARRRSLLVFSPLGHTACASASRTAFTTFHSTCQCRFGVGPHHDHCSTHACQCEHIYAHLIDTLLRMGETQCGAL